MSYHILHQFDEQWIADNGPEKNSGRGNLFNSLDKPLARSTQRRLWLLVLASLMIAACALYFALDARRHAADLQQRLSELETMMKK